MIRTGLRVLHVAMALLFAWSAYLQYNDPDPLPWMAIYVAALVLALSGAIAAPLRWQSALVATIAFTWGMALLPAVPRWAHNDVRTTFYMKTGDDIEEEARECGGLLIVSFWSIVVMADANSRRPRTRPT
jgi:hypothetical protein